MQNQYNTKLLNLWVMQNDKYLVDFVLYWFLNYG